MSEQINTQLNITDATTAATRNSYNRRIGEGSSDESSQQAAVASVASRKCS
jgi:hypothetical protein